MKRVYLLLALFSLAASAPFAQEVSVTTDTLDKTELRRKYAYQTFDQYNQRFLLKAGSVGGFIFAFNAGYRRQPIDLIAAEYRFTKRMSIEGTYFFPREGLDGYALRLRRYMRKGRLADNLSGRYIAVEYLKRNYREWSLDETLLFQMGEQIKKNRFGYADFRIFSGYQFGPSNRAFNLGLNVTIGAGWGPVGKRTKLESPSNDQFSSHREHILITFENPSIDINTIQNFQRFSIGSTVEKEVLFKGFTIWTSARSIYHRQKVGEDFFSRFFDLAVSTGVRKYFGPIKKPSADHPVHSFAGLYVGAGIGSIYRYTDRESSSVLGEVDDTKYGFNLTYPAIVIGYQERLGKRYFYDIFTSYSLNDLLNGSDRQPVFALGTRVGLNWGM